MPLSIGLHTGIHEARYHADDLLETPTLSRSVAHTLLTRSPAHARQAHPRLNPESVETSAPHFDHGRVAHAIVLTGRDPCKVIDADDWRTKAAKEERDEARAAGFVPMLRKDHGRVVAMTQALHRFIARHPVRDAFYAQGRPEVTAVYEDAGVMCRARFDALPDDPAAPVVDYKTTRNAEPQAFARAVWSYGYDLQAAWYSRALKILRGSAPPFILLAQEKEAPFAVTAHVLDDAAIEHAEAKCDEALTIWRTCLATNAWPAYEAVINTVGPPPWAFDREAEMTFTEGAAA